MLFVTLLVTFTLIMCTFIISIITIIIIMALSRRHYPPPTLPIPTLAPTQAPTYNSLSRFKIFVAHAFVKWRRLATPWVSA